MTQIPTPLSPNRSSTDASAIAFSWTAVADATDYEIAIGTTEDLAQSDISFRTGPTNVLTLYEALPEDGRKLFWRVRATRQRTWTDWSESVPFIAGSMEAPFPASGVGVAGVSAAHGKAATSSLAPDPGLVVALPSGVPVRSGPRIVVPAVEQVDGTTTLGEVVGFFAVTLGSFVLLVLLLTRL